jgi:hypothetical protein
VKRSFCFLLIASILTSTCLLQSDTHVKTPEHDQYLCDYNDRKKKAAKTMLYYLHSLLWTKYAPHKWKQKRYGWNPDSQLDLSLSQLETLEQFNADSFKPVFSRFVYSTQDVHTAVIYEDERIAVIPLKVEYIDEHLMVTYSSLSQIKVGDEIVSLNGELPLDHLKQVFYGTSDFEQSRPYFFFDHTFQRMGSRLQTPKKGETLQIGVKQNGTTRQYQISWYVTTLSALEQLSQQGHLGYLLKNETAQADIHEAFSLTGLSHTLMPVSFVKWTPSQLQKLEQLYYEGDSYPTRAAQNQENATLDWSISVQEGVNVGYLKVDSFKDIDFEQIDMALKTLEKKTQCLVIDTRGNPGGIDFSLFGLIMRLTDKPLTNLMVSWILDEGMIEKHRRLQANLDQILKAAKSDADFGGESIEGLPVTLDLIRALRSESMSMIEEWEKGYTCSRFESLRGLKTLKPHASVRYTHPIYIMIDERCASCADIFPAIMRDNNRATLIGRTTSGAGGTVEAFPVTNPFGIGNLYLTTSLLLRNNMKVIEDNGVSPDMESKKTLQSVINPLEEKQAALRFAAKNYKKS